MMGRVICAHCKKLMGRKPTSGGHDSHGICPECMAKELGVTVEEVREMMKEKE